MCDSKCTRRGLPFSCFPCEFHSMAVLASCLSGLLSVCGHVISFSIGCCPAFLHNSSFRILHGHQICRMLLRHFLIITCNVCFSSSVNLQVSAPYKSTALHIWLSARSQHHEHPPQLLNASLGILLSFPFLVTILQGTWPRYLLNFASSQSLHLDPTWNRQKLVFVTLTFKLTLSLCSSKEVSCPACTVSSCLLLPLLFLVTLGFADDLEIFSCPSVHYAQPTRKNPTYCTEQWWWSLLGQAQQLLQHPSANTVKGLYENSIKVMYTEDCHSILCSAVILSVGLQSIQLRPAWKPS